MDVLAAAADRPGGIRLLGPNLDTRDLAYGELQERARSCAVGLLAAGLAPGDRLLLPIPTGEDFLAVFFGAQIAGVVPCPLAPPRPEGPHLAPWLERLGTTGRLLGARAVAVEPALAELLPSEGLPGLTVCDASDLGRGSGAPPRRPPAAHDIAFIQLTSGTTALPKGVLISQGAVVANLRQIAQGSGMTKGDVVVSWLPLFHDMGLVGGVLTPIAAGLDLVLGSPMQFLRRPETWLAAISRFGGTHAPAPTFAYGYVVQRLARRDLGDLDLGSWRVAYVGAEPIPPRVLAAFEQLLRPRGLAPSTLLPCYGMAEASLAVTFKPFREPYRTLAVHRRELALGRVVPAAAGGEATVLTSCGRPLPGTRVRVTDGAGEPLGEGAVGEIVFDGPSLFSGYHGIPDSAPGPGGFASGDLGFLQDGELYVVGRQKEVIILSGENHHPAEIEWLVGEVDGVRAGRVAAFGVASEDLGTEQLHVLAEVEAAALERQDELATAIRRQVREATELVVEKVRLVPTGTIPVTTSGKIQRSRARQIFFNLGDGKDDHGGA